MHRMERVSNRCVGRTSAYIPRCYEQNSCKITIEQIECPNCNLYLSAITKRMKEQIYKKNN
jgi:hypothetical protein